MGSRSMHYRGPGEGLEPDRDPGEKTDETPGQGLFDEHLSKCPAHLLLEPCETCAAYIAGGL